MKGFLQTRAGCLDHASGEEPPLAWWQGQGHSPPKEKVIPSLECCGTGQSLPAPASQGPHIGWHGSHSPSTCARRENLNPSQAPGTRVRGARQSASFAPWHSEHSSNRVAWDTSPWRRDWGVAIFLPISTEVRLQGTVNRAHGGGGTCLHQTTPLHTW